MKTYLIRALSVFADNLAVSAASAADALIAAGFRTEDIKRGKVIDADGSERAWARRIKEPEAGYIPSLRRSRKGFVCSEEDASPASHGRWCHVFRKSWLLRNKSIDKAWFKHADSWIEAKEYAPWARWHLEVPDGWFMFEFHSDYERKKSELREEKEKRHE